MGLGRAPSLSRAVAWVKAPAFCTSALLTLPCCWAAAAAPQGSPSRTPGHHCPPCQVQWSVQVFLSLESRGTMNLSTKITCSYLFFSAGHPGRVWGRPSSPGLIGQAPSCSHRAWEGKEQHGAGGGTGAFLIPELCACPMCHSCPAPLWLQRSHCVLASHAAGFGCAGVGAVGFTCPSTRQRGSTCLSVRPAAARASEGQSEATRVLLVCFAGDDHFLPAAHSLMNRSEDVGREA